MCHCLRQWHGVYFQGYVFLEQGQPGEAVLHPAMQSCSERVCGELQWQVQGHMSALFESLDEARYVIEQWRQDYNEARPHSSLGYQPPGVFARKMA